MTQDEKTRPKERRNDETRRDQIWVEKKYIFLKERREEKKRPEETRRLDKTRLAEKKQIKSVINNYTHKS